MSAKRDEQMSPAMKLTLGFADRMCPVLVLHEANEDDLAEACVELETAVAQVLLETESQTPNWHRAHPNGATEDYVAREIMRRWDTFCPTAKRIAGRVIDLRAFADMAPLGQA